MRIEKPKRATRAYTQHLIAPPDTVFTLLCPVREADWVEGWDPLVVLTASGVAERDCAFVTRAKPADAIWYVTRHDPAAHELEMIKVSPGVTACRIGIKVRAAEGGSEAEITYSHTSLGTAEGDAFVAGFTEAHYREFMQEWESRMNRFLRTTR